MSQLALARTDSTTRCCNCGCTEEKSGIPATTVVIDWRGPYLMCDACIASHDWSDWTFDPILNSYSRK